MSLPSTVKVSIWHDKLYYCKTLSFSPSQIQLIDSIKGLLIVIIYCYFPGSNWGTALLLTGIKQTVLNHFTGEQAWLIIGHFNSIGSPVSLDLCGCLTGSDWCSIPVDNNTTCSGSCEVSSIDGCGTLWSWSCDADCSL